MTPDRIYCHGEQQFFEEDQFLKDSSGKLIVPHVHNIPGRLHYAVNGAAVTSDNTPPIAMSYDDRQEYIRILKAAIGKWSDQP